MGWNDRMADLSAEAEIVALQAKAIKHCNWHEDISLDQEDPDANKHAYALGTIRWNKGDMGCTREEFMQAIKDTIEMSGDECPRCAKIRDE